MPAKTITPADAGVVEGGEDETPSYVVSTRNEISKERAAKRATMSKEERKRSAKCVRALSRPHDAAYTNELKAVKEEPTPKRAEYLMEFAEDMEE